MRFTGHREGACYGRLMDFLHARIHRVRLLELMRVWRGQGLPVPHILLISCPCCRDQYFADVEREAEPLALQEAQWAARVRLAEECPDHPHRFAVEE